MDHALVVRRLQRRRGLSSQLQRLLHRQNSRPESFGQRLALDQLEHQARYAVGLLQPVDRRDVRVVQGGQHVGFPFEARESVGVSGNLVRQGFDRNLALQLGVGRSVDLTHAPRAERRGDLIWTYRCAGAEGHDQSSLSSSAPF
jgi:hypothetical protein